MKRIIFWLWAVCGLSTGVFGHTGGRTVTGSEVYLMDGKPVKGHLLMCRNDSIFLERADGRITAWPLSQFDGISQRPLRAKAARLARLNRSAHRQ